jgi:16S rRNA (guanine966-N2)-methyltransferase
MGVRLTGGALGGRRIRATPGRLLRPTSGRVKEALFSILGERVVDAAVLDLFAGTGAVGFEALSRGAACAVFVERHAATAAAIRENARAMGLEGRAHVLRADAYRADMRSFGRFDVVYVDPPYELPPPVDALVALRDARSVDAGTVIAYERRSSSAPAQFPGFVVARETRYGEATLQFLRVD